MGLVLWTITTYSITKDSVAGAYLLSLPNIGLLYVVDQFYNFIIIYISSLLGAKRLSSMSESEKAIIKPEVYFLSLKTFLLWKCKIRLFFLFSPSYAHQLSLFLQSVYWSPMVTEFTFSFSLDTKLLFDSESCSNYFHVSLIIYSFVSDSLSVNWYFISPIK